MTKEETENELKFQNFKCAIPCCKVELKSDADCRRKGKGAGNKGVRDHCHICNKFRSILCNHHNTIICRALNKNFEFNNIGVDLL